MWYQMVWLLTVLWVGQILGIAKKSGFDSGISYRFMRKRYFYMKYSFPVQS